LVVRRLRREMRARCARCPTPALSPEGIGKRKAGAWGFRTLAALPARDLPGRGRASTAYHAAVETRARSQHVRLAATIFASLLLAACARLPGPATLPYDPALAPPPQGVIPDRVEAAQALHPGQSGFRLVSSGAEAYALRAY